MREFTTNEDPGLREQRSKTIPFSNKDISFAQSYNIPKKAFRRFEQDVTRIGTGLLGGKAECLAAVAESLYTTSAKSRFLGTDVTVPHMHVIATDFFDAFMALNSLLPEHQKSLSDKEISRLFAEATLPGRLTAKLSAMLETHRAPLVVRSSGLPETLLYRDGSIPYDSRFLANSSESMALRLDALKRAVKAVWASLFFSQAQLSLSERDQTPADEKMAIVIQEVFGRRVGDLYFPDIAGIVISPDRRRGYRATRTPLVEASLGLRLDDRTRGAISDAEQRDVPYAIDLGRGCLENDIAESTSCLVAVSDMGGTATKKNSPHAGLGPMDPTVLLEVPVDELIAMGERIVGGPVEIHFAARKTLPESGEPTTAVLKMTPVFRS
jgi:hypothetical protein